MSVKLPMDTHANRYVFLNNPRNEMEVCNREEPRPNPHRKTNAIIENNTSKVSSLAFLLQHFVI